MQEAGDVSLEGIIADMPLFEACSQGFIAKLAAQSQLIRVEKGQLLFVHGDEAARFFLVRQGWVKLFRETLDGAQAVVDILPQGHLFGETSIFENGLYPYSAEMAESGGIVAMPLSLLKAEMEENQRFALSLLGLMAQYRKQQDKELEHRVLQNAPQRIGCFLLRLVDQSADGPVVIHLPYDKTLVASRLGMQPETFSRALGKLKDATGIKIKGATVDIASLERLMEFSCSACSSTFPCQDKADTP